MEDLNTELSNTCNKEGKVIDVINEDWFPTYINGVIIYPLVHKGIPWYTYKQLSEIWHVTSRTIHNWVKSGRVITLEINGVTLYRTKNDY